MKFIIKKNKLPMNIICCLTFFMFTLYPTSSENKIYGLTWLIATWMVVSIVIFYLGKINYINYNRFLINFILMISYMTIVTIICRIQFGGIQHISLARIAPLVALTWLTHIEIEEFPDFKVANILLDIFCILSIILGLGVLLKNNLICDFLYNNYNQYYDNVMYYSVRYYNKPVMFFGVHTYASYFYYLFFLLSYFTYEKLNKKRYLIYCIFLMIFTIFLLSSSAMVFFIMMASFLIYKSIKNKKRVNFAFILLGIICITCVIYFNWDFLYEKIYMHLTNGNNGIVSRYSKDSVFSLNWRIITSSLGIGFNVMDLMELGYSDSGMVVYMTMGSIPLAVFIYHNLYRFLKSNINIEYAKFILIAVFLFEFALPATFNYRFSFAIIFAILYLKSLDYY